MKNTKQHVHKSTAFRLKGSRGPSASGYGVDYTRLKVGDNAIVHVSRGDNPAAVRQLLSARLRARGPGVHLRAFAGKVFSTRVIGRDVMVFRPK